ncbi:zinc finger MYM-type protein 6-like, partial [Aphis craccivora]
FQNITLRKIANAPFYVSNETLHQDLGILPVVSEVKLFYKRFFDRLENHPNPLIKELHTFSLPGNPQHIECYDKNIVSTSSGHILISRIHNMKKLLVKEIEMITVVCLTQGKNTTGTLCILYSVYTNQILQPYRIQLINELILLVPNNFLFLLFHLFVSILMTLKLHKIYYNGLVVLSTLIISKSVNGYTINLEINENNMLRNINLKRGKYELRLKCTSSLIIYFTIITIIICYIQSHDVLNISHNIILECLCRASDKTRAHRRVADCHGDATFSTIVEI